MDIEYFLPNPSNPININDGIEYYSNRYGYRSRTVDPIPEDYGIAAGCSITFGQSVKEEHRFSNLIEEQLGIPIINLGIQGSGIASIYHNLVYMLAVTPKKQHPKFLIASVAWENTRLSILAGEGSPCFNIHGGNLALSPQKIAIMNKFYLRKIDVLCRMYDITTVKWNPGIEYIDQGVDKMHPGPEQHLSWSKGLLRGLNSLLP